MMEAHDGAERAGTVCDYRCADRKNCSNSGIDYSKIYLYYLDLDIDVIHRWFHSRRYKNVLFLLVRATTNSQ